jgi:hypothetical protein
LRAIRPCTLVYFIIRVQRWPSRRHPKLKDVWALLAAYSVDVVLAGHDHDYQRWVPLGADGQPDPNGITQFVVGTGGHGIQDFVRSDNRLAVGYGVPPRAYGALRLELDPDKADMVPNIAGDVLIWERSLQRWPTEATGTQSAPVDRQEQTVNQQRS